MRKVKLGAHGPEVAALGLGCMGMSGMYGPSDDARSIDTLHAALAAGVNLFDTGDFYGMGHNEMLLGQGLKGSQRDQAVLSVKFGALRGPDGSWLGYDSRPAAVKNFLAYSLRRLGTDYIDIYRPARIDPAVPIEETVGAIADLIKAGYVRYVGLSEVSADTIRRAHAVHPVTDVQLEYSLMSRGIEKTILPTMRELGIGLTAYGVLSRGLLSGEVPAADAKGDIRSARMPRFKGDNLARNLALVEALRKVAEERNLTPSQAAIAWVASRGPDIVTLVGVRGRARFQEAQGAITHKLMDSDLLQIERAVPADQVAGTRYDASQMAHLDSEAN